MKTLLIVYHTMTGGTKQMAEAAADAARMQPDIAVRLQRAAETGPDDVLAADGYLFATAENLAAMSGLMKDFFDRCYYWAPRSCARSCCATAPTWRRRTRITPTARATRSISRRCRSTTARTPCAPCAGSTRFTTTRGCG